MQPRTWTDGSRMAAPDPFLVARLLQTDAWRTDTGEWLAIVDAPVVRLWSILGYLRWHAPALRSADPEASGTASADEYLATRPLVVAIDAELARRGVIEGGTALLTLRALGPAPWELPARFLTARGRRRASRT